MFFVVWGRNHIIRYDRASEGPNGPTDFEFAALARVPLVGVECGSFWGAYAVLTPRLVTVVAAAVVVHSSRRAMYFDVVGGRLGTTPAWDRFPSFLSSCHVLRRRRWPLGNVSQRGIVYQLRLRLRLRLLC